MTTELYPYDQFGEETAFNTQEDKQHETTWLIKDIIKPELPALIDKVEECLSILDNNQISRMPITSGATTDATNTTQIQGIITRQGLYILDIQFTLRFAQYRKGKLMQFTIGESTTSHTHRTERFAIPQLHAAHEKLLEILQLLENLELVDDDTLFVEMFGKALVATTQMNNMLHSPPNELNFPLDNNCLLKHFFGDKYNYLCESIHHIVSLEAVICGDEIILDFRNLDKVIKRPWCNVDKQSGKSVVDTIRELQKKERNMSLQDILHENNIEVEEQNLLNSFMQNTFNKESTTLQQAQFFISRCVTFDGIVVTEQEKVSTRCSDGLLVSLARKLDEVEKSIGNHFANLSV